MDQNEIFEDLLKKHRTVIERYINYRMPSSFDADDVIQETYIAAMTHFSDLRNRNMFKSWILSIAKNQCSMWYRIHSRRVFLPLESFEDTLSCESPDIDDSVSEVIRTLPAGYAEILKFTLEGYSQKQIAEIKQIPLGTVKSRLYNAKKLFRAACPPEITDYYERGNKMENFTRPFPAEIPCLNITEEKDVPFFEVRFEEEAFIIPHLGNKNSEGTYRYPSGKLTLVSTCRVPKEACIHEIPCVKICRDTYNVKAGKMYKNEGVWFTQLTDEYIRNLATICFDSGEDDDDYPTEIHTFLEEDYDICVNGIDRIHGKPILIKENPPVVTENGIFVETPNVRYTMGVHEVTIGSRKFETVKVLYPQTLSGIVTENYIDKTGRLVLMRWYECEESIDGNDNYPPELKKQLKKGNRLAVNGMDYILLEDRIGEYAL